MIAQRKVGKAHGLLRGDAAKIARIHRCSLHHVIEVAKGKRPGRQNLRATIERYREAAKRTVADNGQQAA